MCMRLTDADCRVVDTLYINRPMWFKHCLQLLCSYYIVNISMINVLGLNSAVKFRHSNFLFFRR